MTTKAATKKQRTSQGATVLIEVIVYPRRTVVFGEAAGDAKTGGRRWEMSLNVNTRHPIIRLPDGRWVLFSWPALIEAANHAGRAALVQAKGRTP